MSEAACAGLIVADAPDVAAAIAAALGPEMRVTLRSDVPRPNESQDDMPAAAKFLEEYWRMAVQDFVREHARLDVLVTVLPPAPSGGVRDLSLAAFHRRQLQHIVHPWLGLKHASAAMKLTGGALITVGDLAPVPGDVARATAARALANMMQGLALECSGSTPPIRVTWVEAHTMARQTAEVAAAVKLLASSRSSFMTGTNLVLREVTHGR